MNHEENASTIGLLTPADRVFLKKLGMATSSWPLAARECAFKGWASRVGRWHVLTPAGLRAMSLPSTVPDQHACLLLLAAVPDRRCLGRLEQLGMVACEAGFPVLTPLGTSTVDALRAAEEAKHRDFYRSVIREGERYGQGRGILDGI